MVCTLALLSPLLWKQLTKAQFAKTFCRAEKKSEVFAKNFHASGLNAQTGKESWNVRFIIFCGLGFFRWISLQ